MVSTRFFLSEISRCLEENNNFLSHQHVWAALNCKLKGLAQWYDVSVTDVLWLSSRSHRKTNYMLTYTHSLVQRLYTREISVIQCKGNIFKFGVEQRRVGKCTFFNRKLVVSQQR